MSSLFLYELRKRRGAMIGWSVGLAVYIIYIIALYPAIGEQYAQLVDTIDTPLFQAFGDMTTMGTFHGFFSLYVADYVPLVIAIYAIVNGTGTLAGEEEAGTLELILSQPLARWQVVVTKAVAMMVAVLAIIILTAVASVGAFVVLGDQIGATDVTSGDLFLVILLAWPVVMTFMMLALFLGAILPTRRMAAMVVTVLLIASFFGNNLASVSDSLATVQPLFPFYYYNGNEILAGSSDWPGILLLLAVMLLLLLLAVVAFARRNVTVGAWPWQRGRVPG
jgi:ABC-2 type transport system permease protein